MNKERWLYVLLLICLWSMVCMALWLKKVEYW